MRPRRGQGPAPPAGGCGAVPPGRRYSRPHGAPEGDPTAPVATRGVEMATITKDEIDARVAGRTVLTEFRRTIELYSDRTALRWIDDRDEWRSMTFREFGEYVARAATGLKSLGVGPGDR